MLLDVVLLQELLPQLEHVAQLALDPAPVVDLRIGAQSRVYIDGRGRSDPLGRLWISVSSDAGVIGLDFYEALIAAFVDLPKKN